MSLPAQSDRIGFEALAARLEDIFVAEGVAPWIAAVLARNCAACERDGSHSHGVFRIPGYRSTLRSGWVDGSAEPGRNGIAALISTRCAAGDAARSSA